MLAATYDDFGFDSTLCTTAVKEMIVQRVVFVACFVSGYCETYDDEFMLKRLDIQRFEEIMYIFLGHSEDHTQMALLLLRLIASVDDEKSVCQFRQVDKHYTFADNLVTWGRLAGVSIQSDNGNFEAEKMARALFRTAVFANFETCPQYWITYYKDYVAEPIKVSPRKFFCT
ncbi:hypothetical protein CKAH01_11540 [Colletotrichum kahawae]|uniref:Uncharacterized protein n=1 Tax=Colletotrichum kahawae TaxID=34407 RepID=A0AAD9YVX7_COLKA|nr:hypothetical protein CKAH01_11540 [Colletotrichum kahawae]